jgi:hypothetical protein
MSTIFLREDNQTFNAKQDLSQSQYLFLIQDSTSGFVGLPTAPHQTPIGILTNVPSGVANGASVADSSYNTSLNWTTSVEQISPVVCLKGETILQVDAAYPIGTYLMARGDGTYNGFGTQFDGTGNFSARMLSASYSSGDQIEVILISPQKAV